MTSKNMCSNFGGFRCRPPYLLGGGGGGGGCKKKKKCAPLSKKNPDGTVLLIKYTCDTSGGMVTVTVMCV